LWEGRMMYFRILRDGMASMPDADAVGARYNRGAGAY